MNVLFTYLKNLLVILVLVVTVTIATYTEHLFTPAILAPEITEAKGDGAREPTQLLNRAELASIFSTLTAINVDGAVAAGALLREDARTYALNQLAWLAAKVTLTSMVNSITDWVASGFEGRPAFVQDLQGHVTELLDDVAGQYIVDNILGGDSFVCSPFRLDIAAALDFRYRKAREGREVSYGCSFSSIAGNIEQFLNGDFTQGGWQSWLSLTAEPAYTPYGSLLTADVNLQIRLINAAGEEREIIGWGRGFLSAKICEVIGEEEQCAISNPGAMINEQLGRALGAGFDTLVEADEFNELVSALFGQLAERAITGVNGILGLSGNTGYTYSDYAGGALEAQAQDEFAAAVGAIDIDELIRREEEMQLLARTEGGRINTILGTPVPPGGGAAAERRERRFAEEILNNEIIVASTTATANILELTDLQTELANAATNEEKNTVLNAVVSLPLHSAAVVRGASRSWPQLLN